MFNEFKKYYVWAPEHEEQIQVNFRSKAGKLLAGTFCDCRRFNRIPQFTTVDELAKLQEFWNTNEKFKKRSEIGKKARSSEKGGSLHTDGAISQLTRKSRMEKELGRPVAQEEIFKVTHIKKNTDPTQEERLSHVLKRHMKGLCKKFRIIVAPYLLKVKTHRLNKNS